MSTTGIGTGADTSGATWHIGRALLPSGWASNVRVRIDAGRIVSVDADQRRMPGDVSIPVGLPAMSNLHSHAFQRAMSGLTEVRGATDDSFWSWRSLIYRFVHRLSPDMVEAIAALAYVEMLESGFTRVGEFHYLHHDVDGRAYADPAEMCRRPGGLRDREVEQRCGWRWWRRWPRRWRRWRRLEEEAVAARGVAEVAARGVAEVAAQEAAEASGAFPSCDS